MLPLLLQIRFLTASASLALGAILSHANAAPVPTVSKVNTLVVGEIGKGTFPLDGFWQFHLGDDPAWASPTFDDSAWEQITADKPWGVQGHDGSIGFAWYRRHLKIYQSAEPNSNLAILMPPVDDAYELFLNGVKIGKLGSLPPHTDWFVGHRQSFALPASFHAGSDCVLAVRVWKAPLSSTDVATGGGLNASPLIGDSGVIAGIVANGDFRRLRASLYGRGLSYFFLVMGALSLLLRIRNREQKLFLWFAIWMLAKVYLYYLSSDRVIEVISAVTFSFSLAVLHAITDSSVFLFLLYLFGLDSDHRIRRWTWIAVGINLGSGFADAIVYLYWPGAGPAWQWTDAAFVAVYSLSELYVFALIYQGLKRRLDLASKLVALMTSLVYLHEIVRLSGIQGVRFTHWTVYAKMTAPILHLLGIGITSRQILETLLLVALAYALTRYVIEQREHEQEIETELKAAREVQRVMIPEKAPEVPGFEITSVYQPAREVGGDFFQIIPLPDNSTLVILGDVSGKGMKAAMNVSLIIGTLRTLAEFDSHPSSILSGLNRRMIGRLQGGFVTALVFRIDPEGDCCLANAGHLEPFLNGKELKMEAALPLGIVAEAEYLPQCFTMNRGDSLTIYTDGVLEACNDQKELYGFERLRGLLGSDPTAETIAETARTFGQEDDITVLTIHRMPSNSSLPTASSELAAT